MKPTPFELAEIVFETEESPVSFRVFLLECLESSTIHVFNTPKFFIAIEVRVLPKQFYTWPDPQQYWHVHLASGDYREAARFCLTNLPWLPHLGWERYNKFRLHRTSHVIQRFLPNESLTSIAVVPPFPDDVSVQIQAESAPARSSTYSGV